MKKLTLLLIMLISFSYPIWSARNPAIVKTYKHTETENATKKRTPASYPVHAYYDDETNQIEVTAPDHMSGEVFISDEYGMPLGYSSTLNAVFDLPENFHGILLIEWVGEDWDGQGAIEI